MRARPTREALLTLDFKPGATLQVDSADFSASRSRAARADSPPFVAVLAYSGYLYLESVLGSFLRCMERSLAFFGGATHAVQIESFRQVMTALAGTTRIVSLHSRGAESAVLEILLEYGVRGAIFHWYTGSLSGRSTSKVAGQNVTVLLRPYTRRHVAETIQLLEDHTAPTPA